MFSTLSLPAAWLENLTQLEYVEMTPITENSAVIMTPGMANGTLNGPSGRDPCW